ncbi:NUDIX domain-containing protein [Streptomyces sp. DSM 44917]|uniref:NUDIX domain-containing protein n=1 Tax=Streptomyces boetiae TaxID=3075541 RepID=A0ABU2L8H5_9ACTN|nr:NUDIX domain-containing protein [Streptomyces sp. DSM 44917]MDT0307766.1 NUDIX domain-containing protein [Streptomyces sp. DSM 44917]
MPASLPPAVASMTLLVAAVLVHDRDTDSVLLLQRGPRAKFGRGLWDLPVGKCDPGEPVTHAAVRELREETGLIADPKDLRLAHVLHAPLGAESPRGHRPAVAGGGFLTVLFTTHRWGGTPRNAEPHKHAEVRWFPRTALPQELVFSTDRLVERCLGGDPPAVTLHGWP